MSSTLTDDDDTSAITTKKKLIVAFSGHDGLVDDTVQVPLGPTRHEFTNTVMMMKTNTNATSSSVDHVSVLVHRGFNRVFDSSYEKVSILICHYYYKNNNKYWMYCYPFIIIIYL